MGLYEAFKARAEGVSAEVYRFATKYEAMDFMMEFLHSNGMEPCSGRYAVWADCPLSHDMNTAYGNETDGMLFTVTRECAAEARFGISLMQWALADTGTLVQDSSDIDQRLVSSLPSIHIAFVPTSGILPDMQTLLTTVSPGECAYLALITGPSRTADIERVLTIGVHGPERLVILVVDELGGESK